MGADRRPVHLIPASILGAALLLTIELIKGHRSNFWIGVDAQGWLGASITFIVYLVIILAIAIPIDLLVRMALPRRQLVRVIVSVGIAAPILGFALVEFAPSYSATAIAVAGALLSVLVLLNTVGELRGWAPQNGVLTLAIVACALSWIAMEVVGTLSIVHPDRHVLVTILPVGAAAVFFQIGFAIVSRASIRWRSWIPYALFLILGGGLIATPFASSGRESVQPNNRPSLLLVTCDALRADFLSPYGGTVPTPNFERIQDRGATFERAYALAPWTLPSVNALYGSQYPLGLTPGAPFEQWRRELTAYTFDEKQKTLAQRLSAAGYATALYTGNGLVGQAEATRRGFDHFVRLGHHLEGWTGLWAYVPYFREILVRFIPAIADIRPVDTTKVLTGYANGFLHANRGMPVFIWLHYMDPHSPYDPPRAYRNGDGPWPLFCPRNPHWGTPQHGPDGTLDLTPDEESYVRMLYEAEIQYVDESLGGVLAMMDDTGHGSNAIVCLTADHGEEMWDHGKWGHGHTLYDEVIRVPLIVSGPGVAPQRIAEPVSHIDLIPTLADLVQTDADPNWLGESWAPQLRQEADPARRPVFARGTNTLNPDEPLEMVAIHGHKLIHGLESSAVQLFDLSEDSHEQQELSSSYPGIAGALAFPLRLWNHVFPPSFDRDITEPNAEVLEELQALGYVN